MERVNFVLLHRLPPPGVFGGEKGGRLGAGGEPRRLAERYAGCRPVPCGRAEVSRGRTWLGPASSSVVLREGGKSIWAPGSRRLNSRRAAVSFSRRRRLRGNAGWRWVAAGGVMVYYVGMTNKQGS